MAAPTKPSAILAQFVDGVLTRAQAAEQFANAQWAAPNPTGMAANYDSFLDEVDPESFTAVKQAFHDGRITAEDYAAFAAATPATRGATA